MVIANKLNFSGNTDEVLDLLLDQEGLEVDPIDRLEADTPLHKAVRFVNGLSRTDWEAGSSIVELLLDAGADPRSVDWFDPSFQSPRTRGSVRRRWRTSDSANSPTFYPSRRIRNNAKLKAMELVDPRNTALRSVLQKAEFAMMAGNDVVDDDDGDGGAMGSASDSE